MKNRGKFITLEGSEGTGKTTNLLFMESFLKQHDIELVMTREPGGTDLGEDLRQILLDKNRTMDSDTELMLMFAARAEHLHQKILPALEEGKWVLCDRFTDATYAYQGGGRNIDMQRIKQLEDWVQQGLQPDLTVLLDVPVEIGLQRASARSEPDRFEIEKQAFFERVRNVYLDRAKEYPKRFAVIDAGKSLEEVQQQISGVLQAMVDTNE